MSNIYAALEQLQHSNRLGDNVGKMPLPGVGGIDKDVRDGKAYARQSFSSILSHDMTSLSLSIDRLLPGKSQKTVMVIGAQQGSGVSSVVCSMAKTAALQLGRRVLVLDAATNNLSQHKFFELSSPTDIAEHEKETGMECSRYSDTSLYVASLPKKYFPPFSGKESSPSALFEELKPMFDLIVIDASSVEVTSEQTLLSRYVDGVIIVVEAEKTKLDQAGTLIQQINANGGLILGAVFNKRRLHIPKVINNWCP